MSADSLQRINNSRVEIKYQVLFQNQSSVLVKCEHTPLAITRFPDRCPNAVNFSKIGLNKKIPGYKYSSLSSKLGTINTKFDAVRISLSFSCKCEKTNSSLIKMQRCSKFVC